MHFSKALLTLTSSVLVLASPYHQKALSCASSGGAKQLSTPGWQKDNAKLLVPLSDKARTGTIPIPIEEGLIHAVGPRFANVFYDVQEETAGSFLKCATTVIKSGTCIAACGLQGGNIKDCILGCGAKSTLCNCISYFPPPIPQLLKAEVCSQSSFLDPYDDEEVQTPYVEYIGLAQNSLALQAIRGDVYKDFITELKDVSQINGDTGNTSMISLCPLGFGSCGGCSCCVGACLFGQCMGACLPL